MSASLFPLGFLFQEKDLSDTYLIEDSKEDKFSGLITSGSNLNRISATTTLREAKRYDMKSADHSPLGYHALGLEEMEEEGEFLEVSV